MSAAVSEVFDESRWDDLRHEVSELEATLVALTKCMQSERECVTLFDLGRLTETVHEKQQLLSVIELGDRRRRRVFVQAWNDAGSSDSMPNDVPALLVQLAESPQCRGQKGWLLNAASELQALMDVVSELQNLNRAMVGRALQWVNAYVAELNGGTNTYNAKGRVVHRARGTIVRSI